MLRCSFEHATATKGEKSIADKGDTFLFEIIGNVPECVTRYSNDLHFMGAEQKCIPVADFLFDAWNFVRFVARTDNGAAGLFLEFQIAASMVIVWWVFKMWVSSQP